MDRDTSFRFWSESMHTASHRDAFNAGWRAALDAVQENEDRMETLEQMLLRRSTEKEAPE